MDNREKQKAYRERQRAAGLTSVTEWVPVGAVDLVRSLAAALRGEKPKPRKRFEPLTAEQLKARLEALAQEYNLEYHQQDVVKGHQCLMGRNGRLWITASRKGFDICPSGQSLISEMTPFLRTLTGKDATGSKQRNYYSPYWRVQDWDLVGSAVEHYAQTRS